LFGDVILGRLFGTGREGSNSGGKLPGLRGSLEGGEESYILYIHQVTSYKAEDSKYQVPPAHSFLSKICILSKYFSATNEAAVMAPMIKI
jgi:hypothetical protein